MSSGHEGAYRQRRNVIVMDKGSGALTKALGEFEDSAKDTQAAVIAANEEDVLEGADKADFGAEEMTEARGETEGACEWRKAMKATRIMAARGRKGPVEGGSVSDYT
ncbi:hypothetical protein EV363DRAFT_1578502 [Boletus edulis]|nr:hypothetical protein EV363DRAFT_1578502 [Boletus edulis]